MEKDFIQTEVCRPGDLSDEICDKLSSEAEHYCISGNRIYLMLDQTIFCFPNNPAGNELLYALLRRNKTNIKIPQNAREIIESILKDKDYQTDLSIFRKHGIKQTSKRMAAVFHSLSTPEKDLFSIISAMAPAESEDYIIPADYRTAVFVKNLEGQSSEDMNEFIEAVIGTMESEGIDDIRAGIGRQYADIYDIRKSYHEAQNALELGIRYHRQDHVFLYEKQALERIVDSIPEEKKKEILGSFIKPGNSGGLTDEMLETVRVFFRNDLNLTAASKQLFIHRNTLNYRLDKIRKDYGLDLRSFQDAVIFRIVSEIANES